MSSPALPDLPYELLLQLSALLAHDDPASLLALERTCRSLRIFFHTSGVYDDALQHFYRLGLPDPSPATNTRQHFPASSPVTSTRQYFRVCFMDACDRCGNSSAPLVRMWHFKSVLCEECAADDEIWITRDKILDDETLGPVRRAVAVGEDQDDNDNDNDNDNNEKHVALLGLPLQTHTIPYSDEYTMYRRVDMAVAMRELVNATEMGNISKWLVQRLRKNVNTTGELKKCYKRDKILRDWTDKTKAGFLAAKLMRDFPETLGNTSEEVLWLCPSFLQYARRSLHRLHRDPDVLKEEYEAMAEVLVKEAVGECFNARAKEAFDLAAARLQPDQMKEVWKMFYCKICREEIPDEQIRPFRTVNELLQHRKQMHNEAKERECFGSIREIWGTL